MRTYYTIFDKNYLFQGMTLWNSLKINSSRDFKLIVLAMDDIAAELLGNFTSKSLEVMPLSTIEDAWHRKIRSRVSVGQYCWIWQPLFAEHLLNNGHGEVTYLEADSMFFADPEEIFESIGAFDLTLAPHNYSAKYEQSEISGKYITHFNAVKNTSNGRQFLAHWRKCCLQYSAAFPKSLCGQKGLDPVPSMGLGAVEITHPGVGVGPWNAPNWRFRIDQNGQMTVNGQRLVFYHFHEFAWTDLTSYRLVESYKLPTFVVEHIYSKYISALRDTIEMVNTIDESFNYRKIAPKPPKFKDAVLALLPTTTLLYLAALKASIKLGNRYLEMPVK